MKLQLVMRDKYLLTYIQKIVEKRWILVDDEFLDLKVKYMYSINVLVHPCVSGLDTSLHGCTEIF